MCICQPGYTQVGSACININECDGSHDCDGDCIDNDGSYSCICTQPGHVLFTANGIEDHFLRANENGLVKGDLYLLQKSCVTKKCPAPGPRDHADPLSHSATYHFGDRVTYKCVIGFQTLGRNTATLTCSENGDWVGDVNCVAVSCPVPSPSGLRNPGVLSSTSPIPFGGNLVISCVRPGATPPDFTRTRTCTLINGQYRLDQADSDHDCGYIDCEIPTSEPRSSFLGVTSTIYGSTFTYGCQAATTQVRGGSNQFRNATVICLATGKWDFGDLSCPDVRCQDPGQPRHGHQDAADYRNGQRVTFACDYPGYVVSPNTAISCVVDSLGNANFDAPLPACKDIQKPTIPSCPSARLTAPLYTSLGSIVPDLTFTDNEGIDTINVTPAYPTSDMMVLSATSEQVFTYVVTDFVGLSETCVVRVIGQDITKPTFDCPTEIQRAFTSDATITVTFDRSIITSLRDDVTSAANLVVAFTPPSIEFVPATMTFTSHPPVHNERITLEVTDEAGNMNSCEFNVHFEADLCHPAQVRTPLNSQKVCSPSSSGYSCTITCNSGYVLYSDPDLSETTLSCPAPGSAFPSRSVQCVNINPTLEGYFRLSFSYKYQAASRVTTGCGYAKIITDAINENIALEVDACSIGWTVVVEEADLNINDNMLDLSISIEYNRVPNTKYKICSGLHKAALSDPHTYFPNILKIAPATCEEIDFVSSVENFNDYYCSHGSEVLRTKDRVGYCLECPEGTRKDANSCEPCSVGFYNDLTNQVSCKKCTAGTSTYEIGAISSTECNGLCAPGTFSANGLSPCSNCPKNHYWVDATSCVPCDGVMVTRGVGAKSSAECLSKCRPGTFNAIDGYGTFSECTSCPLHTYGPVEGLTKCQDCGSNQFTEAITDNALASSCTQIDVVANCNCVHGNCQNLVPHTLSCICPSGFYGPRCEHQLDPCASRPCLNGMQCNPAGDSYTCTCTGFLSGDNCEVITPSCNAPGDAHCKHNGMCENTLNGPKCHCLEGYSGTRCEFKTDICASNPCQAGSCQSQNNERYVCHCPENYYGTLCENLVDICSSNPCRNGGTCNKVGTTFSCTCSPGYIGDLCDSRTDPCSSSLCGSLGVCNADHELQDFTCVCNAGSFREGSASSACVATSFCQSNPCQNSGVCQAATSSCSCQQGFTSFLCQHEVDHCSSSPCQGGGICSNTNTVQGFNCDCPKGLTGDQCQLVSDGCSTSPCSSAGSSTCRNVQGDFECLCKDGYWGNTCEIRVDPCASNPCLHDATCTDLNPLYDYTCSCPTGWMGKNCETLASYCTGSTCQNGAVCLDVFGDFFCKCNQNSFGRNCGSTTNHCWSSDTCIHGTCGDVDEDGVAECTCPFGYTGDRCQFWTDYCETEGTCQNGGVCHAQLDNFTCECPTGFTGRRCEIDVNFCLAANCPSNAECKDMEDRAYCRCPLQLDGPKCDKAWDPNWDFYFHHVNGIGLAYLPYPIQLNSNSFSIALRVQFAEKGGNGTFFSLFTVPLPNRLSGKEEFVRIDDSKLTVFINGTENTIAHRRKYDDGFWHYMVVRVDGSKGEMTLIVDTVQSDVLSFQAGTHFNYNIWPVLGCNYDLSTDKCDTSVNFHGKLTRVSIYGSPLNFRDVSTTGYEEIDALFPNAILLWAEYKHTFGVERITPSGVRNSCPSRYTNFPACDQLMPGKRLVEVIGQCPKDIIQADTERLQTVSWTIPSFTGDATVESSLNPGDVFIWGKYENIIEARNDDGNAALCMFNIYLQDHECSKPGEPSNIQKLFFSKLPVYSWAASNCFESFADSIPNPNIFSCDQTGDWNPLDPFRPFRISPCGATISPNNNLEIELDFVIPSVACTSVTPTIKEEMLETLVLINNNWEYICLKNDCTDAVINVTCSAAGAKTVLKGAIFLSDVNAILKLRENPSETSNIIGVFQSLILAENNNIFDYSHNVLDAIPVTHDFKTTQSCDAPKVLRQNLCVDCGPGTYYSEMECHFCPIGTFNPRSNEYTCASCGVGKSTPQVGAASASECKAACDPGYYFDLEENKCTACKRGFYQPESGQFFCYPCTSDKTTRALGSPASTDCANLCPQGQQIGVLQPCEDCPIGFYRSTQPNCAKCPGQYVTVATKSKVIGDCTVANNPAGTRRVGDNSTFEKCPANTYQPNKWQDSCIDCGEGYLTNGDGKTSRADCNFACSAGEQTVDGKDECELCPQGSYHDGSNPFLKCTTCSGGLTTLRAGAESADRCSFYSCPAGYEPNDSNNACRKCSIGKYQPDNNKPKCLSCGTSKSTLTEGSLAMSDCTVFCPSGQEKDDFGRCVPCLKNFYKDNSDGLLGKCQVCPDNRFTTAGASSTQASDCNVLNCAVGEKGDYVNNVCTKCPKGTYQNAVEQSDCIPCDPNFSTRRTGSTAQAECESFCDSGHEKSGSGCAICPRGFYKDNGIDKFMPCTACGPSVITQDEGATSASRCTVANCAAGTFLAVGNTCSNCAIGFYQDEKWQTSCKQCGEHKTTSSTGADSIDDCFLECPKGRENLAGTETCQECKIAFYKDKDGAEPCSACEDLNPAEIRITTTIGSKSASECTKLVCPPGHYPSGSECKECEHGTYQPDKWVDSCVNCDPGFTTYVTGATTKDQCWLDCPPGEEYIELEKRCKPCSIGYYNADNDPKSFTCTKCHGGFITESEGQDKSSACTVADCSDPGTYRDATANTCQDCPVGQFQDIARQTMCQNCEDGFSTKAVKSADESFCKRQCPPGNQLDESSGRQECVACPIGTYNTGATWECEQCPDSLQTETTGAVSAELCSVSSCTRGTVYNQGVKGCVDCPQDTYQDFPGKVGSCEDCPAGEVTSGTGSQSRTDCKNQCAIEERCAAPNETCVLTASSFDCGCATDYEKIGIRCIHSCDTGYCGPKGVCMQNPLRCDCIDSYYGDKCENRPNAEALSAEFERNILIIVVCVGGFILFMILLIVACCVKKRRNGKKSRNSDRDSVVTDYPQYGMKPANSIKAPSNSGTYYSPFSSPDPAVYQA